MISTTILVRIMAALGGAKKTVVVVVDLAEAGVDRRILLRERHRREVSQAQRGPRLRGVGAHAFL